MNVAKLSEMIVADAELGDFRAIAAEAALMFAEMRRHRITLGTAVAGAAEPQLKIDEAIFHADRIVTQQVTSGGNTTAHVMRL